MIEDAVFVLVFILFILVVYNYIKLCSLHEKYDRLMQLIWDIFDEPIAKRKKLKKKMEETYKKPPRKN